MRVSVSRTERAFGSPVSPSVAARCSAIARLRRLASTGAAWVTARDRISSPTRPIGLWWVTSSDPITSPPTSDGRAAGGAGQRAAERRTAAAAPRSAEREYAVPRRRARQSRGARAVEPLGQSGTRAGSVLAASWLPLALRLSTTAAAPASERSTWRLSSSCASDSSSAPWSVSTNSRSARRRRSARRAERSSSHSPPPSSSAPTATTSTSADELHAHELRLRARVDVLAVGHVLAPELVHHGLALPRAGDRQRIGAVGADLRDRGLGDGRASGRRSALCSRTWASSSASPPAPRSAAASAASEVRRARVERREELVRGRLVEAADAGLLVEHRGEERRRRRRSAPGCGRSRRAARRRRARCPPRARRRRGRAGRGCGRRRSATSCPGGRPCPCALEPAGLEPRGGDWTDVRQVRFPGRRYTCPMTRTALIAAVLALLVAAPAAQAADASLVGGNTLTFVAADGETNTVTVTLAARRSTRSTTPARRSTPPASAAAPTATTVTCSATGVTALNLDGRDFDDIIDVGPGTVRRDADRRQRRGRAPRRRRDRHAQRRRRRRHARRPRGQRHPQRRRGRRHAHRRQRGRQRRRRVQRRRRHRHRGLLARAPRRSAISIDGTANDGIPGELDNVKTDVENVDRRRRQRHGARRHADQRPASAAPAATRSTARRRTTRSTAAPATTS